MTKDELHQLLAGGRTQDTLDALLTLTRSVLPDLYQQVTLQSGRFRDITIEERNGIINGDEARRVKAHINSALLQLINELPSSMMKSTTNLLNENLPSLNIPAPLHRWTLERISLWLGIFVAFAGAAVYSIKDAFGTKATTDLPFNITIFVHGPVSHQQIVCTNTGKLIFDLGGDRRTAQIGENGRTVFSELPSKYSGQKITFGLDAEGYTLVHPDSQYVLESGKSIYLEAVPQYLDRMYGQVIYQGQPLSGVIVSIAGTSLRDTANDLGQYELLIPLDQQQSELELTFFKPGFKFVQKKAYPQTREPLNILMSK